MNGLAVKLRGSGAKAAGRGCNLAPVQGSVFYMFNVQGVNTLVRANIWHKIHVDKWGLTLD